MTSQTGEAGIAINPMGKYLHTLVELRLVRRVLSEDVPDRTRTRISRYEIRDPFLRFYFHFVYRHPELVEQNRTQRLVEIIRQGFDSHVGRTGYEELARRAVAEAGDQGKLPFEPMYVGRAWDRQVEIDVVAIAPHQEIDQRSRQNEASPPDPPDRPWFHSNARPHSPSPRTVHFARS